jgi:chemotaxis protein CheY-P-specific phosphatase CheC
MTSLSWQGLLSGPNSPIILRAAMTSVAHGLTRMLGEPISCAAPEVRRLCYAEVLAPEHTSRGEVGIHLQIESGLSGSALVRCSLELADQLVTAPSRPATVLAPLHKGALAEVGNVMLAYFLNAVVELTGATEPLAPSPPRVLVDMLSALLGVVLTPAPAPGAEIVLVEAVFQNRPGTIRICLWLLPDIPVPSS